MSLRLLLDEDSQAKYLVDLLQAAGQNVLTVNEADLMSRSDSFVLDYVRQQERVLLTLNCSDFQELHQANPVHPGILAVFVPKISCTKHNVFGIQPGVAVLFLVKIKEEIG